MKITMGMMWDGITVMGHDEDHDRVARDDDGCHDIGAWAWAVGVHVRMGMGWTLGMGMYQMGLGLWLGIMWMGMGISWGRGCRIMGMGMENGGWGPDWTVDSIHPSSQLIPMRKRERESTE